MRLKKLSLHGYKTFASKTTFEFNESITAVVGPNGSGKSNIADAIRWVLGEQSYSTLRGKRTTDMIFAGSQQRARAGMAQAILTLDNEEGWLPIDFSEIEIGRRAYRSGENEYLINGQKVRLRDITELLANSGLAQRTYTIIGQGLVDQALSLRADERRMLFEEAAGVSHYKIKRAETLRRLEETTRNLERLRDIVTEIRPRLNSLRLQASRARNYEQVAADLRHHLLLWYGFKWGQAKIEFQHCRTGFDSAKKEWEAVRRNLSNAQEQLQAERRKITQIQRLVAEQENRREELRQQLEKLRREVAVLAERQSSLNQQLADLEIEIPRLQEQQNIAQNELNQAVEDLGLAQSDLDHKQEIWQKHLAVTKASQEQIEHWQATIERVKWEETDFREKLAQTQGRLAQLRNQLEERNASSKDKSLIEEIVREIELQQADVKQKASDLFLLEEKLTVNQNERLNYTEELNWIQEQITRLDHLAAQLRDEIGPIRARWEILDKLNRSDGGIIEIAPEVERLIDFLEIPNTYRRAVEAALDHKLFTYFLPDLTVLWDLVNSDLGGRINTAILQRMKAINRPPLPDHSGIIGWAHTLIRCSDPSPMLGEALLGHILIVRDNSTAFEIAPTLTPGLLAVSLDGFVAFADGLVQFGLLDSTTSPLARKEEVRQLEIALNEKREQSATLLIEIDRLQNQKVKIQAEIGKLILLSEGLSEQIKESENELVSAQKFLALVEQRHELTLRGQKMDEVETRRLEEQITQTESAISLFEDKLAQLSAKHHHAQSELDSLPVLETTQATQQLQQQLEAISTIFSGRQAVVDSRRATLSQIDNLLKRRLERRDEILSVLNHLNLPQKQAELDESVSNMDEVEVTLRPIRDRLGEARSQIALIEDSLNNLQKKSHELETAYTTARIGLSQQENIVEGLRERITSELGLFVTDENDEPEQVPLPIADFLEKLPKVQELPSDIEESIHRLRGQLTRMGGFNPDAPAEYEETQQRHDFLNQQIEDLDNTQQRLRQVIDDLDIQTSKAFAETVRRVDDVFGDVFQRLFGGGSAQLVLTEPEDLTISGVDIVARLPRRREQGLALLSGGERSLTAAALIFALLKVSPTPFCILDEVDAMLDEANVNRFRELMRELSQNTQFIIITHNRGTVQVAESVYGISMGADSVSQVISIRPEDYLKQQLEDEIEV